MSDQLQQLTKQLEQLNKELKLARLARLGVHVCERHGVAMKKREKQGDTWYNHAIEQPDGSVVYCRGYPDTKLSPGWEIGIAVDRVAELFGGLAAAVPISYPTRDAIWRLGRERYGDNRDAKVGELAKRISNGRTSDVAELTEVEGQRMRDGIEAALSNVDSVA